MRLRTILRSLLVTAWVTLVTSQAGADDVNATGPVDTPATAPASQPAHEIVLVRIDDQAAVTQEDFNLAIHWFQPRVSAGQVRDSMVSLVEEKLLLLYVQEHPELITPQELEATIDGTLKNIGATDRNQMRDRIFEKGGHPTRYRQRAILQMLRDQLLKRGAETIKDEALLRRVYDANPDHFNGARVVVQHILISFPVFATPEEKRAARKHIEKIRDDLVAQRRTWEECVQESHCNSRSNAGLLGPTSRYQRLSEPVAKAAFALQPGELSDIVESHLGYHLIRITERRKGLRDFEDEETKRLVRSVLQYEGYNTLLKEMWAKYPVIGVRAPTIPPEPERKEPAKAPITSVKEKGASTRPSATRAAGGRSSGKSPAATQPAGRGPAVRRPAATRPAAAPARPNRPPARSR